MTKPAPAPGEIVERLAAVRTFFYRKRKDPDFPCDERAATEMEGIVAQAADAIERVVEERDEARANAKAAWETAHGIAAERDRLILGEAEARANHPDSGQEEG